MEETRKLSRFSSFPGSSSESETEELHRLDTAPSFPGKKGFSRQLSMGERHRDVAWEKRRSQVFQQEKKKSEDLTDEDLNELKGSIELGFGFKEEEGQRLCNTLPALDLYFAVNRHYHTTANSPISTPDSSSSTCQLGDRSISFEGGDSTNHQSWMICSPGDDPQQVKIKLRHWAQAVACSVLQSC